LSGGRTTKRPSRLGRHEQRPNLACPARLPPATTRSTRPTTADTAKHPAAKNGSGYFPASMLILQTNNVCFGKAEPTPKHTRRASSSQGGAPVKSLGGGIYWGPNFLRGGCLDGSAAAATAKRHFKGGDSERGFARERCAAIEAVGGAVGRIA